MTEAGAVNYAANTITDSGSNVWTLAGQCLQSGTCGGGGGYSSEFYSMNAATNSTATQTVNFTGTGDATINFYDFVGVKAFDRRTQYGSSATTTTLLPNAAFSFTPYVTSVLTVAAGPIAFNTAKIRFYAAFGLKSILTAVSLDSKQSTAVALRFPSLDRTISGHIAIRPELRRLKTGNGQQTQARVRRTPLALIY